MEQFQNLTYQKLTVFLFAVFFIIFQSCFLLKGTNYFLILPSLFLVLTYKPKLMGYGTCFALGLINDIFAMQMLGVSSIMFIVLKFAKTVNVSRSHKDYVGLLMEYCIYSLTIFLSAFVVMLMLDLTTVDGIFFLSILLLLLGFFICDFLWLKIFGLFNKK
tara:strand:+ start:1472 stop:1954 length:483 start_codon:yes stop_codon:yes gene_type:complete